MLEFKPLEIADKTVFDAFFKRKNHFMCCYCFTDVFMWRTTYDTRYAVSDGFIFLKYKTDDGVMFFPPVGEGDFEKAMKTLADHAKSQALPFCMSAVPPEYKDRIEQAMPGYFDFIEDRDSADYIYTAERLMYLKGKKLHGKRNHINKFLLTYKDWGYEPLTDENTQEFFAFFLEWCDKNPGDFGGETRAVSAALENREALGIKGGILRVNGRIAGITLGSESFPDTFIVHIEKADTSIDGAYQMINQQFAQHNFEKYTYIDREEDLGIEGLRKAKLSYYPEFVTEVYNAVPR